MDKSTLFPPGSDLTRSLLDDLRTESGAHRVRALGLGPWDTLAQHRAAVPASPTVVQRLKPGPAAVAPESLFPAPSPILRSPAPRFDDRVQHSVWGWSLRLAGTDAAMSVWVKPVAQALMVHRNPAAALDRLWAQHEALELETALRSNNPVVLQRWWAVVNDVVHRACPGVSVTGRLAHGPWRATVEQVFGQVGPAGVWAAHVLPMIDDHWPTGLGFPMPQASAVPQR